MADGLFGATLRLRVCTWNVGNAPPPPNLCEWLGTQDTAYDIIAVGAQEANFKEKDGEGGGGGSAVLQNGGDGGAGEEGMEPSSSTRTLKHKFRRKLGGKDKGKPVKSPSNADVAWTRNKDSRRTGGEAMNTAGNLESRISGRSTGSQPGMRKGNGSDLSASSSGLAAESLPSHEFDVPGFLKGDGVNQNEASLFRSQGQGLNAGEGGQKPPEYRISHLEKYSALIDMSHPTIDMSQVCRRDSSASSDDGFCYECPSDESISTSQGGGTPNDSNKSLGTFTPGDGSESDQDGAHSRSGRWDSEFLFSPVTPDAGRQFGTSTSEDEDEVPYNAYGAQQTSSGGPLKSRETQSLEMDASPLHGVPKEPLTEKSQHSSVKKFSKGVQNCIGNEYMLIAKHRLMEIKLLVFIHRKHKNRIGKAEATTEATGIGNVVGNKGAVAVKVSFDDTTFCFISSHLAAHEGTKFLQHRNADVHEIMRNLEKGGGARSSLPCVHQFTHIIWMGDLNYRLDLERGLPQATMMSHGEKWDYVRNAINENRFKALAKFDELHGEMAKGNVFYNFQEGELTFAPTFKVVRGTPGFDYQRLRIPSYCDRILWHSLPMHQELVQLQEYGAIERYTTSDHKPVYAVFEIEVPRRLKRYRHVIPESTLKCTVDFQSMRLLGLYEKSKDKAQDNAYDVLECGTLQMRRAEYPGEENFDDDSGIAWGDNEPSSLKRGHGQLTKNFDADIAMALASPSTHTRRGVRVEFYGMGVFLRDKVFPTDVPLKNGTVRACTYSELPKIPLVPVDSLNDLMYKYIVIVFTRWGSKIASSCILPLSDLVLNLGTHKVKTQLDLTKFGEPIAHVDLEVELCISMEAWIDSKNNLLKIRR